MDEFQGKVVKGPFAVGSKSEHEAVYLRSKKGVYVLRRVGGNAFHDPELEKLVGKIIQCHGVITGYTLLITDWTEVP